MEADLRLALEGLRGELKRLDTVLKMSMAEQRRVNQQLGAALERQVQAAESLESRMERLQIRLSAYTGGVIVLWLIFQVVVRAFLP